MFGINDALTNDTSKFVTPAVFYEHYKELIELMFSKSPSAIMLMTPTFNGPEKLDEYAQAVRRIAKEYGLEFIDLFELWKEHYDPSKDRYGQCDWLSDTKGDACHPTPNGAKAMAKYIFEQIIK
jgi:lysophospholipase L1-like esterase